MNPITNALLWVRAISILAMLPLLVAWRAFDVPYAREITWGALVVVVVLTPLSLWVRYRLKKQKRERFEEKAQRASAKS